MGVGLIGRAVGLFAVTNIDDLVILSLFFAGAAGRRGSGWRIVAGQYLGFGALLALSVAGALGASLLPERFRPLLGLVPIVLGFRAAWQLWRSRREPADADDARPVAGVLTVAGVTLANGGDNLGVYIPVFTHAGTAGLVTYSIVFLVLVGVWCAAGRFFATREIVAMALARWGHLILPVVLIAVGLLVLLS